MKGSQVYIQTSVDAKPSEILELTGQCPDDGENTVRKKSRVLFTGTAESCCVFSIKFLTGDLSKAKVMKSHLPGSVQSSFLKKDPVLK